MNRESEPPDYAARHRAAELSQLRRLPPRRGEQTEEILREAGHDAARIAELREMGAIQ